MLKRFIACIVGIVIFLFVSVLMALSVDTKVQNKTNMIKGKVTEVDNKAKMLTVADEKGNISLCVNEKTQYKGVKNITGIKVGDNITVKYVVSKKERYSHGIKLFGGASITEEADCRRITYEERKGVTWETEEKRITTLIEVMTKKERLTEKPTTNKIKNLIEDLGHLSGGVVIYTRHGPIVAVDEYTSKVITELANIGEPAIEPLIVALTNKNRTLRYNAAMVLHRIKDIRAVEPLIALLKDESPYIQAYAASALEETTGQSFGKD